MTEIFLTSGTSWTVPSDWNDLENTIECIGAGAEGGPNGRAGGGGGAYAIKSNLALTPNDSITIQIGNGTLGWTSNNFHNTGRDTYFNGASLGASSCGAEGGYDGTNNANTTGGQAANSIGDTKYSGGAGGNNGASGRPGGGGGGAAGPNGAGGAGGNASTTVGGAGGQGDNGSGGAGGSGGTAEANNATAGSVGTEWTTHGSGGGGGGGGTSVSNPGVYGIPGAGAAYGGGSGGIGTSGADFRDGGNGLIRITYTPSETGGGNPIFFSSGAVGLA